MDPQFLSSKHPLAETLNEKVSEQLGKRLQSQDNFNSDEIKEVSTMRHSFFPEGFSIKREFSDEIRALCNMRSIAPKEVNISSHRKYVGPLIVAAKKILWRFLASQYSETFRKIDKFNTQLVVTHIKMAIRAQEVEGTRVKP